MKVFVCRHGNTFGPDQHGGRHVMMAGSRQNIPLVAEGRKQAGSMAEYLAGKADVPMVLVANHLIRTWEYAAIIRDYFWFKKGIQIPLVVDERLLELDYGMWAGLPTVGESAETNAVIAHFGIEAWNDWQLRRIIPNHAPHRWQVTQEDISRKVKHFFHDLTTHYPIDATILTVASQGSMGFIPTILPGGMDAAIKANQFKVKTGHFCELVYDNQEWNCLRWDAAPV